MFDINGGELLVLAVVALIVVGPERLPRYMEQLRTVVKRVRALLRDAETKVREEVGDADLRSLDPRQYDPRHVVRDALRDDEAATRTEELRVPGFLGGAAGAGAASAATPRVKTRAAGAPAPYDTDAT